MLTDEMIEQIAEEFIIDVGAHYYERGFKDPEILKFARALLAEAESVITDLVSRNDALIENERKLLEVLNELRNRRGKSAVGGLLASIEVKR